MWLQHDVTAENVSRNKKLSFRSAEKWRVDLLVNQLFKFIFLVSTPLSSCRETPACNKFVEHRLRTTSLILRPEYRKKTRNNVKNRNLLVFQNIIDAETLKPFYNMFLKGRKQSFQERAHETLCIKWNIRFEFQVIFQ